DDRREPQERGPGNWQLATGNWQLASPPNMRHLHPRRVPRFLRPNLGVAVVAAAPDAGDGFEEVFVGGAAAEEGAKVGAFRGEEAGEQFALGGEARARA